MTLREHMLYITLPFFQWTPADAMVLDALLSLVIANRWSKSVEKTSLFIVGPASSGKTELLRGLVDWTDTFIITNLTEKGLFSGFVDSRTGKPCGLVSHLHGKHGALVIFPDLTTQLSGRPEFFRKLMGDLRQVLDGQAELGMVSGSTSTLFHPKLDVGVIAAVTHAVALYEDQLQQMGQRTLSIMFCQDRNTWEPSQHLDHARRVRRVIGTKIRWRAIYRQWLQLLLTSFITDFLQGHCRDLALQDVAPDALPTPDSRSIADSLDKLAILVTGFRTRPISGRPTGQEGSARLMQQFYHLGAAHMLINHRSTWCPDQITFLRRIARDSLDPPLFSTIRLLYNPLPPSSALSCRAITPWSVGISTGDLAVRLSMKAESVEATLRQWQYTRLVQRLSTGHWALVPQIIEFIQTTRFLHGPYSLPIPADYPNLITPEGDLNEPAFRALAPPNAQLPSPTPFDHLDNLTTPNPQEPQEPPNASNNHQPTNNH